MKLSVRPQLQISSGNDFSTACNVRMNHNDNEINVRLADTMVKDGFNTNGLAVGVKNDRFDVSYDVANNAPRLRLNSHVNVQERRIDLVYRNALKDNRKYLLFDVGGSGFCCPSSETDSDAVTLSDTKICAYTNTGSSLECGMDVDDNNRATIIYDLSNFDRPNHKSCALRWTLKNGDYEISPQYDLGSETLCVHASYDVDSENRLHARYNMNSNMGSLQWTNNGGLAGDGELRITASANLANADSAKQMPTLLIEKTFDVDT